MAVVNVTPDSFSDGGAHLDVGAALEHSRQQISAGAHLLDCGGESTRPGSKRVSSAEEQRRVLPVIRALSQDGLGPISIDSYKADVVAAALEAGAHLVNDISALQFDPALARVVAEHEVPIVLMHTRADPEHMQSGNIVYTDVLTDVRVALERAVEKALRAGIVEERIIIDPGIGFGKLLAHNLALTRGLGELRKYFGRPLLYGPSRKSFLGEITGRPVAEREPATAAATALGMCFGADIVRVHDVAAVRDAAAVGWAMRCDSL